MVTVYSRPSMPSSASCNAVTAAAAFSSGPFNDSHACSCAGMPCSSSKASLACSFWTAIRLSGSAFSGSAFPSLSVTFWMAPVTLAPFPSSPAKAPEIFAMPSTLWVERSRIAAFKETFPFGTVFVPAVWPAPPSACAGSPGVPVTPSPEMAAAASPAEEATEERFFPMSCSPPASADVSVCARPSMACLVPSKKPGIWPRSCPASRDRLSRKSGFRAFKSFRMPR